MSAEPDLASRFVSKVPGQEARKPSITIHGVPPYVTRTQVLHALNSLGLNPEAVAGCSFSETAVHVEVYSSERPASRPAWRWTPDGKDVATHRLTIPIVDKEAT